MPDYQQAKIYRIVNDSIPDKVYYGATTQSLVMRMASHRSSYKKNNRNCSSKPLFETGKALIVLVENYPCNSKEELDKKERYYIENNDCVNKNIPLRTKAEYYVANRERIVNYKSQSITCECGKTMQVNSLIRHKKTNLHKKKSALLL